MTRASASADRQHKAGVGAGGSGRLCPGSVSNRFGVAPAERMTMLPVSVHLERHDGVLKATAVASRNRSVLVKACPALPGAVSCMASKGIATLPVIRPW